LFWITNIYSNILIEKYISIIEKTYWVNSFLTFFLRDKHYFSSQNHKNTIEKMITVSKSGESERYPKSFIRIINFYRIFGFSFVGQNNEKNKRLISIIRDYLLIFYNIFSIVYIIVTEYIAAPKIFEQFYQFSSKPLMRALYYAGVCMICTDLISTYILSLIRSKTLINLLKRGDFFIVDINTKRANILIFSKIVIMSMISIIGSYSANHSVRNKNTAVYEILLTYFSTFLSIFVFVVGILVLPVIYCNVIWIITSQINNLKNNISEGNIIQWLLNSFEHFMIPIKKIIKTKIFL